MWYLRLWQESFFEMFSKHFILLPFSRFFSFSLYWQHALVYGFRICILLIWGNVITREKLMSRHFENRHNDRMTVPGANIPNVYFYEHKCDSFRPLRHFLTFFEKTPKKIENVFFFQTSYFFLFSIVTLRLLAKHYVSITENGNIWRFRALFALFKRAKKLTFFFQTIFFLHFFIT